MVDPGKLYGPYITHYRYVLRWRWLIIAGWAVAMVALTRAFGWLYEKAPESDWLVPAVACVFSFVIWIAELRNRQAIHRCRAALKTIEDKIIPSDIPKLLSGDIPAGGCKDRVKSHGFWITVLVLGSSILCGVGTAYLAYQGGKLQGYIGPGDLNTERTSMANYVIAVSTVAYVALTCVVVVFMYRQTQAQRETIKLQAFQMLATRMEAVRQDRKTVRSYFHQAKADQGSNVSQPLPPDVEAAADRVCREFDYLGLMDRESMVDHRLVDLFYSVPFVQLYEVGLGDYVQKLRMREERGPTHFWELVEFYGRVKNVPKNHPGLSGQTDWPPKPRVLSST